jgi:hypothetical protein
MTYFYFYISRSDYDMFVGVNQTLIVALTIIADIPFTNEIWAKWVPAALNAAKNRNFAFGVFFVWPLIHDTQLLQRTLSMCNVTWDVSETHPELILMCVSNYSLEKDGRRACYHAPKTAQCYAKALIAARLPHLVEGAEVPALFPIAEAQFHDVVFQVNGAGLPLGLLCSLCAGHLGDNHQALVYAKEELIRNLNPLKQILAQMALAAAECAKCNVVELDVNGD